MSAESKFATSQSVRRVEDDRFLTGRGRYVEDVRMPGMLRAFVLRSPVGHADITDLDVSAAKAHPGVHLVLTAADLDAAPGVKNDMEGGQIANRDGTMSARPPRPILAVDRVRYVGEPVACVVAETLAIAKDAAELIEVDYDILPAVVETDLALAPDQPLVQAEAPGNLCYDWGIGDEAATDAALAAAHRTVELELVNNRVVANPMETRGGIASWDGERLTMEYNGQGVWDMKGGIASHLGLDEEKIRVLTPDVGGGFGMKAFNYPEHFCIAQASIMLGQPVQWIGERTESILSDAMGRDHVTKMVAGFDANHRITAMKIEVVNNLGAYLSLYGVYMASDLASRVLTGVYDIQTAWYGVKGVFTNTAPTDAYRGAGRPEAQYQLERLMDQCARVLEVDPLELRRINFIKTEQFPYQTIVNETYDVGDFNKVLDTAIDKADWAGFAARKAESAAAGKLRGRGLCYYIESILGDQDERAEIIFAEDGMVDLLVGTQSAGQGHETVFAQFLHERAGIPFDKIRFVQGDSDRIAKGGGTGGSRSVTMQGTAVFGAADDLIEKMKPLAEEELEAAAADLEFVDGAWRVAGTDKAVDLMALAEKARREGRVEFLSQRTKTTVPGRSFPNGCHIAEVEVDPDTGHTLVVDYCVVDDFGRLMNPMLAEGQVHGGVVQGIGQALCENTVYDSDGQLLSATFMDYAMPRAADVPYMPFHHEGTPSTANDIGMKGCGEAGTVGACAAVVNALLDALWDEGVTHVDMPATPQRVWKWVSEARDSIS
ncbi:MAG: xanthine dehydrogenase family protein molybdopterin-binding subunit [Pseudomonadota bacterium]